MVHQFLYKIHGQLIFFICQKTSDSIQLKISYFLVFDFPEEKGMQICSA